MNGLFKNSINTAPSNTLMQEQQSLACWFYGFNFFSKMQIGKEMCITTDKYY